MSVLKFGIETRHRKLSIPEKGINTQHHRIQGGGLTSKLVVHRFEQTNFTQIRTRIRIYITTMIQVLVDGYSTFL